MIRPRMRESMSLSLLTSSRPLAASARVACSRMWSGSWLLQHVVDQVGRDRHLPAALLLAGMAPLDQAGNHRAIAEHALEQVALVQPGLEIVAQHVLVEQLRRASARLVRNMPPMSPSAQTASE